jgi:hypothetical protein
VLQKAELSRTLIQRTTSEAPQRRYVLHGTGRTQENDQLLCEGWGWSRAPGMQDRIEHFFKLKSAAPVPRATRIGLAICESTGTSRAEIGTYSSVRRLKTNPFHPVGVFE